MYIDFCTSRTHFNFVIENGSKAFCGKTREKTATVAERIFSALKLILTPLALLFGSVVWLCEKSFGRLCKPGNIANETLSPSPETPPPQVTPKKIINQKENDRRFIELILRLWCREREAYDYTKMQDDAWNPFGANSPSIKNQKIDHVHGFRKIFAVMDSDLTLTEKVAKLRSIFKNQQIEYPEFSNPVDITDTSDLSGHYDMTGKKYEIKKLFIERNQIRFLKEIVALRPIKIREIFVRTNKPDTLPQSLFNLQRMSGEAYSDVSNHEVTRLATPISGKQCVRYT